MPTKLETCQEQAKHLPLHERASLIKNLIEGLDEHDPERLWIKEAARRLHAFKTG